MADIVERQSSSKSQFRPKRYCDKTFSSPVRCMQRNAGRRRNMLVGRGPIGSRNASLTVVKIRANISR
jgi:hypothetical protein